MARLARFVDLTKCIACRGCQVACKQWNQLKGDIGQFTGTYQSHQDLASNRWTMIRYYENKRPDGEMDWVFRKSCCFHCGDPSCVKACPNNALRKEENGAVNRIPENCVGCGYCATYCPFGIPKVDPEQEKMFKCIFCFDRISNGHKPACVKTCVPGAISFGPRDEVLAKAETRLAEVKKQYPKANIYGKNELGGLGMLYLLPDEPAKYDLPVNPTVPVTLTLLKDVVQPLGNVALAGTVVGLAGAALVSWRNERMKGGKGNE